MTAPATARRADDVGSRGHAHAATLAGMISADRGSHRESIPDERGAGAVSDAGLRAPPTVLKHSSNLLAKWGGLGINWHDIQRQSGQGRVRDRVKKNESGHRTMEVGGAQGPWSQFELRVMNIWRAVRDHI